MRHHQFFWETEHSSAFVVNAMLDDKYSYLQYSIININSTYLVVRKYEVVPDERGTGIDEVSARHRYDGYTRMYRTVTNVPTIHYPF